MDIGYTPSQENIRKYLIQSITAMEVAGIYEIFFSFAYKETNGNNYYMIYLSFETKQKRDDVLLKGYWGGEWLKEFIKYFEMRGFEWHTK